MAEPDKVGIARLRVGTGAAVAVGLNGVGVEVALTIWIGATRVGIATAVCVICAGEIISLEQASVASSQVIRTINLAADLVFGPAAFPGFNCSSIFHQETVIFDSVPLGNPAIQVKGERSICGDPFTIIPPSKVEMGSG